MNSFTTELQSPPRSTAGTVHRAAAFLLGAIAPAVLGSTAQAAPGRTSTQVRLDSERVAAVLFEGRAERFEPEQLSASLARFGPGAIPDLFSVLAKGSFDVRVHERGRVALPLEPGEESALIASFGLMPWNDVRAHLVHTLAEGISESERICGVQIVGAHGSAREFPLLAAWSRPEEDGRRASRSMIAAFGAAIGRILDRDAESSKLLTKLYDDLHPSLVAEFLTRLGVREDAATLSALSELLGRKPAADRLVFAEIGHLGRVVRHPIDLGTRARTRAYLLDANPALVLEAVLAAERLEDGEAVPYLIDLLHHQDLNVRNHALSALKAITHQQLGRDVEEWREWHTKITQWWRHHAQQQIAAIGAGDTVGASRAILELSKQRYYRHDLAEALARGLDRSEEELIVLTCAALGHLGSPLSGARLRAMLEHSSVDVQRAALLALRRLTGEDHGETASGWLAAGW